MTNDRPRYWLMKSEPNAFSFDDLLAAKGKRTCWDGIRNYQARNFMRDDMRKGDRVLYYHSNAKPPGVVGLAEVVKEAYPDHTQFDPASHYHDPQSDPADPRWLMVDIKALRKLPRLVELDELKSRPELSEMAVVQRGQRLSIQPVTPEEWAVVLELGGLTAKI
ncbi:MAG: EVE domain-containing protein [Planctomycetes bacterium]|nr:EVE domain-containing protein [Planctomycetota bacterium]